MKGKTPVLNNRDDIRHLSCLTARTKTGVLIWRKV